MKFSRSLRLCVVLCVDVCVGVYPNETIPISVNVKICKALENCVIHKLKVHCFIMFTVQNRTPLIYAYESKIFSNASNLSFKETYIPLPF